MAADQQEHLDYPRQPWPPSLVYTCPYPECEWAYFAPSEAGDRHQQRYNDHRIEHHFKQEALF